MLGEFHFLSFAGPNKIYIYNDWAQSFTSVEAQATRFNKNVIKVFTTNHMV